MQDLLETAAALAQDQHAAARRRLDLAGYRRLREPGLREPDAARAGS